MKKYDYLIVGCGLYGSVIAERLHQIGKSVLIIEKRDHIGGNCFSYMDEETGIIIHKYGTHIFHTSDGEVWNYMNKFSDFNRYTHKVLSNYKNRVYVIPINLNTINSFYNINLKPFEVDDYIKSRKTCIDKPLNFEEKATSLIGTELYEAFIKGYTIKQWNCNPKELPASIIERLPVRKSYNDAYFNDYYQGLPLNGYTPLFEKMLFGIGIELKTDFFNDREYWMNQAEKVVYTGPIDRYFNFEYGRLNWRSVHFVVEKKEIEDFQGASVINYPEIEIPYTRIHEPKHLHNERKSDSKKTIILREYSYLSDEEQFYPVNLSSDKEKMNKYEKEIAKNHKTVFGGRLASYKYLDMDKVVKSALEKCKYL